MRNLIEKIESEGNQLEGKTDALIEATGRFIDALGQAHNEAVDLKHEARKTGVGLGYAKDIMREILGLSALAGKLMRDANREAMK